MSDNSLNMARSFLQLANYGEGPESRDQSAQIAIAYALIAIVGRLDILLDGDVPVRITNEAPIPVEPQEAL